MLEGKMADRKPLIIYGTGNRAPGALDIVREEYKDYEPVAYTSKRAEKVGGSIRGLPVLSREEVKRIYGDDMYIYISPAAPVCYEIQKELLEIGYVTKEQIVNYTEVKKYLSCPFLESMLIVGTDELCFCCTIPDWGGAKPAVAQEGNAKKDIENAIKYKNQLIADLQNPEKVTPCTGCCMLKETYYRVDRKFLEVAFGQDYPCNLSCIYCSIPTHKGNVRYNKDLLQRALAFDPVGFIKELETQKTISKGSSFILSAGEITVAPRVNEILDAVSGYRVRVNSNAVLFNEKIAELCSRSDGSCLLVSVDAGTRETYRRVRGADAYEQTKETLRRYRGKDVNLILKYIIVPENCGRSDLDGFAELAAELTVDTVIINRDQFVRFTELGREIHEAGAYLEAACKARGIRNVRLDFSV